MKNLSLTNLNSSVEVLNRDQMKKIVGGSGCCIYYRTTDGSNKYSGKTCGHSVSKAQNWYNNGSTTKSGSHYVSGYCCASC